VATNIYEELWDLDDNRCTVSGRGPDGRFTDEGADILLDEQAAARGGRVDQAGRPLFARVNPAKLELPTYKALVALLDNYVVNTREPEDETPQEAAEINAFLDLVLPTRVMKRAFRYVTEDLGERLTAEQFRAQVFAMWFQLYTNFFRGQSTKFCSGFEHVFVGEGKFNRTSGRAMGEVSGYHNWIKFHLDEQLGRVNFLGHFYELRGGAGPGNLKAVTLRMIQFHTDLRGNVTFELFKSKGGFFVGVSPECQFALGTVAFYDHLHSRMAGDKRRASIGDTLFDIVLFREVQQDNKPGRRIRSFFPMVLGDGASPPPPEGDTQVVDLSDVAGARNGGPVVVVAALPNPAGADEGTEWVKLRNVTDSSIDLANWVMADRSFRTQRLTGTLAAGETKKFMVTRATPQAMQLGNGGGAIAVMNPRGERVATVTYGRAAEGQEFTFAS
jgi:poly(U)-specific endoribonuclease